MRGQCGTGVYINTLWVLLYISTPSGIFCCFSPLDSLYYSLYWHPPPPHQQSNSYDYHLTVISGHMVTLLTKLDLKLHTQQRFVNLCLGLVTIKMLM